MSKTNADAVAERRLRPIYDWLDNGNNKKAIQEADKVLKKQPDLLCAKVLKGLALLRLGKNKDCEEILESVQKEVPADDCTLQAMTICYREIHKLEKICDVYEKAVLKDPFNEELNTHLFMSYVRIGDYKKQQQVALNLYKIKPKNPYYFWGVMSILMQAQNNDKKIAQKVMLPLAERMVKKFIDEGKIEAEQEIQLHIMILEMQKKYQAALDVIDSDLGQKVMSYYMFSRKRIKLLQLLEKWRELNTYAKKMILEEPDAYSYYVTYIDSTFKLMSLETKLQTDLENCSLSNSPEADQSPNAFNTHKGELLTPDDTIEQCVKFIERCQKENELPHRLRGPYLASLLLFNRLSDDHRDPSKYLGSCLDMFRLYFELFAEKACCFKDLHQFLPLMQNECIPLLSSTWALIKQTDEGEVKNKKQMMMYLAHFEISRYFGIYELYSVNDKLTQISRLLDFYHDGHRFNVNMISTDFGCSDTFMILVVHSLHDLYLDTNDLKFIKDAICLLEYAYNFSPSNHHFKLLLLKLYNKLGASKAGYKYFQSLEIKHVQYDSLGYLECWSLLYSGQYSLAVNLLDNTLKFFNINYKEAADQLTHAYKYGSFEKVNEFLNFREKLKNSFHYSLVTIEHLIHDIIHLPSHDLTVQTAQQISINPEKPVAELDHLVDNRDIYLFMSFDPDHRRMNDEYAKLSFSHEVSLIRLRTMILRCIGASINVSLYASPAKRNTTVEHSHSQSNGVDEASSRHIDIFLNVIKELRDMYKSILENPVGELPKTMFSGVEQSRLFLYTKSSFFLPLFIDAMSFAHEFCSHCLNDSSADKQLEQIAEISASAFSKLISDCNTRLLAVPPSCDEIDHRAVFEYLSLVVEIICIMCIICGNFYSMLVASSRKACAPTKKKKKKGKEVAITTVVEESSSQVIEKGVLKIFTYYLSIVKDNIKTFEIHLSLLETCWTSLETHKPAFQLRRFQSQSEDEPEFNPVLGISDQMWCQIQSNVNDNLSDSFKSSVKQFRNMVKHKIEYLSLLSF